MRGSGNRRQVERISQSGRTPDAAAIIYGQAAKYILVFLFSAMSGYLSNRFDRAYAQCSDGPTRL